MLAWCVVPEAFEDGEVFGGAAISRLGNPWLAHFGFTFNASISLTQALASLLDI